ncbi:hypothetical protein ACFLX5_03355 [Chloroflexota bacterium]
MPELTDYSGPYKHDLKWDDFSKDFLVELMKYWQKMYMRMSGLWMGEVEEEYGPRVAEDFALSVFKKVGERLVPKLANIGNIQLNTVLDSLKLNQLVPDGTTGGGAGEAAGKAGIETSGELFRIKLDIKNENHAIMTCEYCRVLEALERDNQTERIKWQCGILEKEATEKYFVNPKIKVTPIKIGPRESREEPACVFEFKLEE